MINFNSDNIFVGYIKQLLSTFNLPSLKIYIEGETPLFDGALYIKDNQIVRYGYKYLGISKEGKRKYDTSLTFNYICNYEYDKYISNYTKTLKLNTMIYDYHTHEYLGEYLRFLRDYKKIDLMSLYNCFSNNSVKTLYVKDFGKDKKSVEFYAENENYKIFMIPVKIGKKYTIAIDCNIPYEMFCGYYNKGYYKVKDIADKTYFKKSASYFKHPYIYSSLENNELKTKDYLQNEKDLKLFIKLPIENNSTITILEGDYTKENNFYFSNKITIKDNEESGKTSDLNSTNNNLSLYVKSNLNFKKDILTKKTKGDPITAQDGTVFYINESAEVENTDVGNLKMICRNQLLFINSKVSHPFSSMLVSYLLDNVVSSIESIQDNIKRVQISLNNRYNNISNLLKAREDKKEAEFIKKYTSGHDKAGLPIISYYGIWDNKYKAIIYNIAKQEGLIDSSFDVLGYYDKNIEKKLGEDADIYEKEANPVKVWEN